MKFALSCLLLIILSAPGIADTDGHPVTLWEVKGNSNSVYLLGSIHLLRPQDYPLPTAIDAAYADAEALVMEIDMDDLDPFAAQVALTSLGVLHDEQTLQDLMGARLYKEAQAAADAVDIPLDMLAKTEPWYAAMTVEILMLGRMGFDPLLGVEMHLVSKAQQDGKTIDGFETIEEQIQFLDGMSLPAQRQMLLSTLEEAAKLDDMMEQLIDAWRHGDIAFLEANMLDELAKHEELNKLLVTDRNTRWVRQIDALLRERDDYLIVVGALHLIGPHGVPGQLRQKGFDVRQLSEPPTLR